MKVELLYIGDCPNYRETARILKKTLRECGLRDDLSEIAVTDSAQADALEFIGSPSIRIEGEDIESDIEPLAPGQPRYGLSCRTYLQDGKLTGIPPLDLIRAAIRSAAALAYGV
jgi:hypothetical protein